MSSTIWQNNIMSTDGLSSSVISASADMTRGDNLCTFILMSRNGKFSGFTGSFWEIRLTGNQKCTVLKFSLMLVWTSLWTNNQVTGDFRCRDIYGTSKHPYYTLHSVKSLWPSGTTWYHGSWSTLVQATACCLFGATSYCLNQCFLIVGLDQNGKVFFKKCVRLLQLYDCPSASIVTINAECVLHGTGVIWPNAVILSQLLKITQ